MSTRKSMAFPITIALIFIVIIIYLFATIKQTEIICNKSNLYDEDIKLDENIITKLDGKSIKEMYITKTIVLPEKYSLDDSYLNSIKFSLENTLEYLGDNVKYTISDNKIVVSINVSRDEVVLLDNIEFIAGNDGLEVKIDSNTKSSNLVTLAVGDSYTDGEFMKKMKNKGYNCK